MALLFIMSVCLLVYAALEYRIRTTLKSGGVTVPDQKDKPTSKPTARWVFELFADVHVLSIKQPDSPTVTRLVTNLDQRLRPLLEHLRPAYARAYS